MDARDEWTGEGRHRKDFGELPLDSAPLKLSLHPERQDRESCQRGCACYVSRGDTKALYLQAWPQLCTVTPNRCVSGVRCQKPFL